MKRRNFIKGALGTTVSAPFILNGFRVSAFARSPLFDALLSSATNDRILVLIQLAGGNDGLNTVIPLDVYANYRTARPSIYIQDTAALKLTANAGLHPAMTGLQNVYNAGKVRVVQAVGYPSPNDSHFRSTDIWMTGAEYYETLTTGWAGRFLDSEYPGYPTGYPNTSMPDPLAVQIGGSASTSLEGPSANMGLVFSDTKSIYRLVDGTTDPNVGTRVGKELKYLRDVDKQVQLMGQRIIDVAAANNTVKSSLWPATTANNDLATQLKIVSQLIRGGMKTRMYLVSMTGFDTHSAQGGATGTHATLLKNLSDAITAFQDELRLSNAEDKVVGMTFSEFGRRVKDNGTGTDHGAAAPLFVFGTNVIPGVLGSSPALPSNPTVQDNVPMQYDFRSIYASLLKDWFKVSDSTLLSILYKDYPILPIIKGASGVHDAAVTDGKVAIIGNYPNPVVSSSRIRFRTAGGSTNLTLFDNTGKAVHTLIDRTVPEGEHETTIDASSLSNGTYYCRLQCGATQVMKTIVVTK